MPGTTTLERTDPPPTRTETVRASRGLQHFSLAGFVTRELNGA